MRDVECSVLPWLPDVAEVIKQLHGRAQALGNVAAGLAQTTQKPVRSNSQTPTMTWPTPTEHAVFTIHYSLTSLHDNLVITKCYF